MGYYTDYSIQVEGDVNYNKLEEIAERINEVSGYYFYADINKFQENHIMCDDTYKWYNWHKHMKSISKEYPELLFKVEGVGEEHDDHWKCNFINGRDERMSPEVIWPESQLEREFEASKVIHEILTED